MSCFFFRSSGLSLVLGAVTSAADLLLSRPDGVPPLAFWFASSLVDLLDFRASPVGLLGARSAAEARLPFRSPCSSGAAACLGWLAVDALELPGPTSGSWPVSFRAPAVRGP